MEIEDVRAQLAEAKERLREATETIEAIRNGEVDALVVKGAAGETVYTLVGADQPYRIIVEEMSEGAVTLSDGTIFYANKSFAKMLRASLDQLTSNAVQNFILEEQRNRFDQFIENLDGQDNKKEFTLSGSDGEQIPVKISATPLRIGDFQGLCLIVTDLTQIKQKEANLKKLGLIYDSALWGLATLKPDGVTLETANAAFAKLHGYSVAELIGKPRTLLFPKSAYPELEDHVLKVSIHGRHSYEVPRLKKDGSVFPSYCDEIAVKDEDGKTLFHALNIIDITEKKQAEEALRKVNERLEERVKERTAQLSESNLRLRKEIESRKRTEEVLREEREELRKVNKEMELFVQIISHDLKAPLRSISGLTEILIKEYEDRLEGEAKDIFKEIVSASSSMNKLIDDLVKIYKTTRIQRPYEKVEVSKLIDDIKEVLKGDIQRHQVELKLPDPLPSIEADPVKMRHIFQNLLNNAIKYSAKKGDGVRVRIGYEDQGDFHEFHVKDNGIGIEPEYFKQIFNPFSRLHTREEYEGSGAGLYIVKKLVEDHKGSLRVNSKVGKGSTFYFRIPKNLVP